MQNFKVLLQNQDPRNNVPFRITFNKGLKNKLNMNNIRQKIRNLSSEDLQLLHGPFKVFVYFQDVL